MKVFLGERVVVLKKKRPVKKGYFIPSGFREIQKLFLGFEADDKKKKLVLYSSDYPRLKKGFLALFRLVEAAGGFVRNEHGEVLFIFRRGRWDLPKGKIDGKKRPLPAHGIQDALNLTDRPSSFAPRHSSLETPAQAAIREVQEETGLQHLQITGRLKSTYHIYNEKKARILKKTYWFEMSADGRDPLIPETGEEITEVRWIPKEDIPELLTHSYHSLWKLFR